jgi:hypothetical protein
VKVGRFDRPPLLEAIFISLLTAPSRLVARGWTLAKPAAGAQVSAEAAKQLRRKGRPRGALNKRARESNRRLTHHPRPAGIAMIRFLLRFIGLCLLATAFVLFVYDGTKTIANQQLIYMKVSEVWAIVDQHSLNLVQAWLKQKALWAWDPYMEKLFELPSWIVIGIIAMVLVLLGRKKKPLIGYARD